MKVALVNPTWESTDRTDFGCRESHLPLELGYGAALLEGGGHDARVFDAQLEGWSTHELAAEVLSFAPAMIAIMTAPSYGGLRCGTPGLHVAEAAARAVAASGARIVAVGRHATNDPCAALNDLEAAAAILGESEEVLLRLANTPFDLWELVDSVALPVEGAVVCRGAYHRSNLTRLPSLRWSARALARHRHHHHRVDRAPDGPGAEIEASRGGSARPRPRRVVLAELDALIGSGVRYVYFVDDTFALDVPLLHALGKRDIRFGVQLRISQWEPEDIELLARVGCVSIDADVDDIHVAERVRDAGELAQLLVWAGRKVPFVRANLLGGPDDACAFEPFRARLRTAGVRVHGLERGSSPRELTALAQLESAP